MGFRFHFSLAHGRARRAVGGLLAIAIPLGILAAAGYFMVQDVLVAVRYRPAAAEVTAREGPGAESAAIAVSYRYAVGGQTIAGRCAADEDGDTRLRRRLGALSPGDRITVYYDPRRPERCVLHRRLRLGALGVLMFVLPFLALGVSELHGAITGRPLLKRQHRGGAMMLGGPGFVVFTLVAAVGGLGFAFASSALHWTVALPLGLTLLLGVIPGATWLAVRIGRRERKARRPQRAHRSKMAVAAAVCLFWCGITGLFLTFSLRSIWRHHRAAARFVSTPGVVTVSRVKSQSDSDSTTYRPVIRYRYRAGGKEYFSQRYAYGTISTNDPRHARKVVARHAPGSSVTVYYDPDNPADAVLRLQAEGIVYLLLLFLQPFVLVGLMMIGYTAGLPAAAARMRRFLDAPPEPPWTIPTWGVLRHEAGGVAIRGRVRRVRAAAVGYGLGCLLGALVAGLFGGIGDPPPRLVGGAFVFAAGLGAAVAIYAALRGKAGFHVDQALRRVTITRPRAEVSLGFDEIDCWLVRPIRNPRLIQSDYGSGTVPLLAVAADDGRELPVHVFATGDSARELADRTLRHFADLTGSPAAVRKSYNRRKDDAPRPPGSRNPVAGIRYVVALFRRAARYADLT